ncbi:unnamed protein product [Paramecium sonneborni]|uniref:Uncharacterized protein n=1 Tax=Paramecium sonneborni TaxID=65129 RepID=A0A8S1N5P1_9CILI|nr:unnamed protein product [Paramecium sonneborni]
MQQIFSQDSHCNQEANQQNFAEEFINAFDISVFCKNCNTQMTTCDMKLLFSHYLQCEINQQYQDDKCDDSNLNNIKQYFQGNKIKDKEQIENTRTQLDINQLREQILIKSELGQSSKEQYQSTINEYLIKERIQSMSEITNISLMKFLQQEKASLQRINAISQIRKILNLPQTHQICLQYQVLRKQAKSQQTKHPHQPWNLCFIQKVQITFNKFLDDLCRNQKEILAYRIYILYELAARISELKQITFQMILTGQVTYLPNKQRKQGPKAIRNFIISEEVIMQTQIFMNRNKINIANTLNIGYQNQTNKIKIISKIVEISMQFFVKSNQR